VALTPLQPNLERVNEAARRSGQTRFTALLHHVDVAALERAFRRQRRAASPGIDRMKVEDYERNLEVNLQRLHARIWIIDFCYYNRLLIGAVAAIRDIETLSKDAMHIRQIDISTKIERAVAREGKRLPSDWYSFFNLHIGTWAFYVLVFGALIGGIWFSVDESQRNSNPSQPNFSAPG
jgi:hypothetical protein